MAAGWREWLVATSAAAALACGFLPWWGYYALGSGFTGADDQLVQFSAWESSTRWTAAVVIAVAAALLRLAWGATTRRASQLRAIVCLAAVALAVFLTVNQALNLPEKQPLRVTYGAVTVTERPVTDSYQSSTDIELPGDDLIKLTSLSEAGVQWGFWAGLAAILLVGASVTVSSRRPTDASSFPSI